MPGRLTEKVCVITGTGGGIGRASALVFAREGALVVGCDMSVEAAEATVQLVRDQGGEIVSRQPCNLADPAECQALADMAITAYGRIDALFNVAARAYFSWLEDISDAEWDTARR